MAVAHHAGVPATVETDLSTALAIAGAGGHVVLLTDGAGAAAALAAAEGLTGRPAGRLAVVVGDPGSAGDRSAAEELAAEVFARAGGVADGPSPLH